MENKRKIPGSSIREALFIYTIAELYREGKIVEIGCIEYPVTHPLKEDHECCLSGHSTAYWVESEFDFVSVDVHPGHCAMARKIAPHNVVCQDGIKFLQEFNGSISMLFLDAWGAELPDSADKHLEAIAIALPKMAPHSLIMLNDTNVKYDFESRSFQESGVFGGKGKLAIPFALENGYDIVFQGRQTLLERKVN